MSESLGDQKRSLLVLGALGIVYGDIGTSPLYALRECFSPVIGLTATPSTIYGILSLLIWALLLVVTVKYLWVVMRADNQGEGGILALVALAHRDQDALSFPQRLSPLIILGLLGAAFVYGDGIITPAISVLSAVEGLNVATSLFNPYLGVIAVSILFGLFAVQSKGTGHIGQVFGPIMLLWFVCLAVLGVSSVIQSPQILESFSPLHGSGTSGAGLRGLGECLSRLNRRRSFICRYGTLRERAYSSRLVYDCAPEFAAAVSWTRGALAPGAGRRGQSLLSPGPQLADLPVSRTGDDRDRHCLPSLTQWGLLLHPASDPLGLSAPHAHSAYLRSTHWADLCARAQLVPVRRDDQSGSAVRLVDQLGRRLWHCRVRHHGHDDPLALCNRATHVALARARGRDGDGRVSPD